MSSRSGWLLELLTELTKQDKCVEKRYENIWSFEHFCGNNTQVWYTFGTKQENIVIESWSWKHRLSDRLSERIVQGMAMIGPESNKMLWVNFSSFFNANQILLFQLCLSVYLHSGKSASRFEKESEVPQSFLFDFRIFCQIQCEAVERVVHPLHEHMSVI